MKTHLRFLIVLFTAFTFFTTDNVMASHAAAGFITYSHVSGNTYELTLTFYRDCSGVSAPTSAVISYNSSCGAGTVTLPQVSGTGQPLSLSSCSLPITNTTCMGGITYGIEEWVYTGMVNLPVVCNDWTFSFFICCRNPVTTTVGSGSMFIETTLDNISAPTNSSPVPLNAATAEFSEGIPVTWNQNFTDADNDSLVYSLVCPGAGAGQFVFYQAGLSCMNPIQANPVVFLNPSTGQISFTPTAVQSSILALQVDEYRGGVLIGSVVSNLQVNIAPSNLCLFNDDSNLIVGKAFVDGNQNGIYDSSETGFTNASASFTNQSDTNYAPIVTNGWFFGVVDTGSWATSLFAYDTSSFSVSPDSITSNFGSQTGQIDTVNFAVQLLPGQPDLCIEVIPLTPARPGFDVTYRLIATNVGTDTITGDVQYIHDSLLTLVSTIPNYSAYTYPLITWNFTNLAPFQSIVFDVELSVPAPPTVNIGDLLGSSVIINPVATDEHPNNNFDTIIHVVTGAYDPNDKWVNKETITSKQIPYTDNLDYLIRFQNTGTDTAFRVIVRDTLDYLLDQSTLNIIHASHDYLVIKRDSNVLEFQFNNILLADSNTNEPASHGYIAYQIKPKSTFSVGNIISNRAAIYFDYNLPILTNLVTTEAVLFTGIAEHNQAKSLMVYPNPTNGKLTISSMDLSWHDASIKLYNALGQIVLQEKVNQNNKLEHTIDVSALAKGVYQLVVVEKDKYFSTKVLIK